MDYPLPKKVESVLIDPDMATAWLERNTRNRPLRKSYAQDLSRDMANGRWNFAGETIKFDWDGVLMDGQHRLEAIRISGTTQEFVVVPNLEPKAMRVIDTGAKRSAADALAMGSPGAWENIPLHTVSAASRIGVLMDRGRFIYRDLKPTQSEIVAWAEEHPDIKQHARRAHLNGKSFDAPPAVVGYAMWRLAQIDTFEAGAFFDRWIELQLNGSGDPLAALIRRLRSAKDNRENLPRPVMLGGIFRAWNACREGKTLERMLLSTREGRIDIPEPK
jgi:hypothetical protein